MAPPVEDTEKHCWVCFASERDDVSAEWVSPCRCKGCTRWIHQACLQRWLDEKQRSSGAGAASCPQCGTQYHIVFPQTGPLVFFLQHVDRALSRVSPFAALGVLVGTAYWSAVTYGAVTVMQVVGHKKGLDVMERADPLVLLVGLPTIPVLLVLGKMIRWEDCVVRLWQRFCSRLDLHAGCRVVPSRAERPGPEDHTSVSRTLCGALIFPSVASLVGRLLFRRVSSSLQRTVLGGIAFVLIKGGLKVYHRQQQHAAQTSRQILNYPDGQTDPPDTRGGACTDHGAPQL